MSLRAITAALAALALAACGDSTGDIHGFDAGHDAGMDGALPDGALPDGALPDGALPDGALPDGALPDGALPDGALPDGALPDGALPDGALPDGGGMDADVDLGSPPVCTLDCTSDTECGTGERCLIGGSCATTSHHCEPAGHLCGLGMAPCGTGEHCGPVVTGDMTCVTDDGSECATNSSCPLGYNCEADSGGVRHCINRRHGCSLGRGGCVQGFFCLDPLLIGQFCVRTVEPCTTVGDCHYLREGCGDADGDGTSECLATGACLTNADCPGETCDLEETTITTACGPGGFCQGDGDCMTGYHCVDVHEDGYRQCIPTVGCQSDSECPIFQLCVDIGGHGDCDG